MYVKQTGYTKEKTEEIEEDPRESWVVCKVHIKIFNKVFKNGFTINLTVLEL